MVFEYARTNEGEIEFFELQCNIRHGWRDVQVFIEVRNLIPHPVIMCFHMLHECECVQYVVTCISESAGVDGEGNHGIKGTVLDLPLRDFEEFFEGLNACESL